MLRTGIISALSSGARYDPEYTRRHQALCGHLGTIITASALSCSILSKIRSIMWKLGKMYDTPVLQSCALASTASERKVRRTYASQSAALCYIKGDGRIDEECAADALTPGCYSESRAQVWQPPRRIRSAHCCSSEYAATCHG